MEKYFKRVSSLVLCISMIFTMFCMPPCMSAYADADDDSSNVLAFPGAEGGGKYTKGARAGDSISVYHVTNLNESGSGSFADAVSSPNRIIVFDVGGTINLSSTLKISSSNLTILGQTAPGDGITFTGSDLLFSNGVSEIIMRYIRVRPTDVNGGEPDGLGGRWNKNIIVDHCSTSWSVDEGLTLYAGSSESTAYTQGSNITVQNTISSESLRMSNHFKGAHGYGAIIGATNSTWYHNLFAHHDSRSPRLDRELQNTDVRNNIIYDWGQTNSAYGAEPYSYNSVTNNLSYVNWVNNYYKYGPGTRTSIRSRIFDVSNSSNTYKSKFYFSGNYVYGYNTVTNNNSLGINNSSYADLLTSQIDMDNYALTETEDATTAYNTVLGTVGASLPKRDAIDARVVNDVKNQTGRIINNADEVGGVINTETTTRTFEIPDAWKTANSMGNNAETDIVESGDYAGYTWIEAYVNYWTAQQSNPTNPTITVTSPAITSMDTVDKASRTVTHDGTVTYTAVAAPKNSGDPAITKVEIYDGSELIKTVDSASVNETLTLTPGTHYLTSRAYNENGEQTQSPTSIVYSVSDELSGGYTHAQIGTTDYNAQGGAWGADGEYTIMGSGSIATSSNGTGLSGVSSDSCDFMYRQVSGDFAITVKMDSMPKVDNGSSVGLMVREGLNGGSKMLMISDGWLKYGENVRTIVRDSTDGTSTVDWFKDTSGNSIANSSSYDTTTDAYAMPKYMRIERKDDTFTLSVSNDGTDFTDNARQPVEFTLSGISNTLYVGLAADASLPTGNNPKQYYMSEASFSELNLIAFGDSDTDSGRYKVTVDDEVQEFGVIRFFQEFYGLKVDAYGFGFIGSDGKILDTQITMTNDAKTFASEGFYGDLYEIDSEHIDDTITAVPFVKLGDDVYYGDVISAKVGTDEVIYGVPRVLNTNPSGNTTDPDYQSAGYKTWSEISGTSE